jgi:AraC family transcriptional regulator
MNEMIIPVDADRPLPAGHFFGQVLNKEVNRGLVLSEIKHTGRTRLPKHYHELAFFNLLLRGAYQEFYLDKDVVLDPLTVIFTPSGVPHHDEIASCGMHIFSLELDDRWLERLSEFGVVPQSAIDNKGGELSWLAHRMYREFKIRECSSPIAIEGLTLEMLALVGGCKAEQEKTPPIWLSRAVEMLHAEFQRNLTVAYLASQIGVHPMHLSRVFRKFHKQSIGDYLHRLRVQFATKLLAQPDIPLATIAATAGFADQSHFIRVFKQFVGLTPGSFRLGLTWHDRTNGISSSDAKNYDVAT